MLPRLLHPLDKRQQTLLLTTMSFGGASAEELLDFLPDDDANALRQKVYTLSEIPKEKRVPLMVRQLRQLIQFRATKGLEGVEPSWLIAGFRGESPRTVAIVLMHMPSSIARQIQSRLPDAVRNAMPSRQELRGIPLEIVKLVRTRFNKFASMPTEHELEELRFVDLVLLTARELVTLVRKVGANELAVAFVAVGKRALAELLGRLPPEHAEELIAAVKRVTAADQIEFQEAQAFLGRVMGNFHNTDELFQKAGLYRLARSIAMEESVFVRQLSQRFPRAHGRLLTDYLSRVRQLEPEPPEKIFQLRDQVLEEVADLARRGKIDGRYAQSPIAYESR
jgi:hypothetical protein